MARQHIHGLDKPFHASIRGETDLLPSLRRQARAHEHNRLESVAEVLILVALMKRQNVLTGGEAVSVGKAIHQFGKGVRADNTHAAHCLPGQLRFNDAAIHEMQDWQIVKLRDCGMKPLNLDSKLRNLGGRTDVVDEAVNKTDSNLEILSNGRGLKPLFGEVAGELIRHPAMRNSAGWGTINAVVSEAVESYRQRAALICETRLREQAGLMPGAEPGLLQKIQQSSAVSREYLDLLQNDSLLPEPLTSVEFSLVLRDVVAEP